MSFPNFRLFNPSKRQKENGSRNHPEVSQFYGKILTINERNNYEKITETIMKKLQTN